MTVERTARSTLSDASRWALRPKASRCQDQRARRIAVPAQGTPLEITVDARECVGTCRFAQLTLSRAAGAAATSGATTATGLHIPITLVGRQPVVTLSKSCSPATIAPARQGELQIAAANNSFDRPTSVGTSDVTAASSGLVAGRVTGATPAGNGLAFAAARRRRQPPNVTVAPGVVARRWLPAALGLRHRADRRLRRRDHRQLHRSALHVRWPDYSRIGIISNGYGSSAAASAPTWSSKTRTSRTRRQPNNVLAPFWTDLNPAAGGAIRVGRR